MEVGKDSRHSFKILENLRPLSQIFPQQATPGPEILHGREIGENSGISILVRLKRRRKYAG